MIKSLATLLFSADTSDKFYAFKTLFPRTWAKVWNSGYDRGAEKALASQLSQAFILDADKVQISSSETLTEHLSQDAQKAILDALQYSGDGQSLKKIVIDHIKAPHSGLMGIAGEEIERGQIVTIRDDGKLYKATSCGGAETDAGNFRFVDVSDEKGEILRQTIFTYEDGKILWFSEAMKRSYLSSKSPEYAVAAAKYDQARRNGKKSSHFKAEMEAIEAQHLAETARSVAGE